MSEPVKEGPSAHALRQLNNRNNLAGLKLRKTLEQFDREKSFSIAVLDRDKFDTRDFLKNVKYCDSDYLPQARSFLGSPSQRRRRSQTAKTEPCRIGRGRQSNGAHMDLSDDETLDDVVTVSENRAPVMDRARLLASRKTAKPFKLNEFQRAEKFLRQLREQVAIEELQSHYTDEDYSQFLNAVVTKISRNITPSLGAPSVTNPQGPTVCPMLRDPIHTVLQNRKESQTATFDMVYPIKLLGNFETKYDGRDRTPSPSLGYGSPNIRATPLGVPEGGSLGLGSRLVVTAPHTQPTKPWTPLSMDALRVKTQSELDFCMMRAMLRSGVRRKPLDQRVQDFCQELDEIRSRRASLTSQSMEGRQERRNNERGEVGYSVG